jgi:beta-galactosidase
VVENSGSAEANCTVVSEIVAPDGKTLLTTRSVQKTGANGTNEVSQTAVIERPILWSLESPSLYELRTTIVQDGRAVDRTTTMFGVRTIRYDANKGFFLNGQHVEIQGTASQQDLAGVGAAVPDSLQSWRVQQL